MSFSFDNWLKMGNFLFVECNLMDNVVTEGKNINLADKGEGLGIYYTIDLLPSFQYQHTVSKAMEALGLTFGYRYHNINSFFTLAI